MRLIDADALHEQFYDLTKFKKDKQTGAWVQQKSMKIFDSLRMIDDAPTIDAVPLYDGTHKGIEYVARDIVNKKGYIIGHYHLGRIVRCKDCKSFEPERYAEDIGETIGSCTEIHSRPTCWSNDFCSMGERSEE